MGADTYELTAGRFVKWSALSRHANKKAVKPWIGLVTGTHDEYGVDMDWLDSQTIDGDTHFDVSDVTAGDYIKVSGASHNNKKHAYYRVEGISDDELLVDRVTEATVLEAMTTGEETVPELRSEIMQQVAEIDDEETLRAVKDVID